jgi:cell division protein FtsB
MKKRTIKLRFKLIILACFLAYTGFVIYSQQANIGKLLAEQETLTQQYEQVQTDLNRLQHKSDYMDTRQYVEDTAREKLGLVYDGELIFETDAPADQDTGQ